jgi:hypothetical protein
MTAQDRQTQATAQQRIGAIAAREAGEDLRGDNQSNAVYAEQQTELQGRHAVFALNHERRRADV